jgi:hypothetical protein
MKQQNLSHEEKRDKRRAEHMKKPVEDKTSKPATGSEKG